MFEDTRSLYIKIAAIIVVIALFVLYSANNRFTVGYHIDEVKKGNFVGSGEQDYHHPLLLLQATRVAVGITELLGLKDEHLNNVFVGRTMSAIFAVIAWYFSFLLFSTIMSRWEALAVSVIAACTPIIAVHAHYMKEDTFLQAGIYGALWALVMSLEKGDKKYWLFLALFLGSSFSSHYKSSMLVPIMFVAPLLKIHKFDKSTYFKLMGSMMGAVVVFSIINYPLFVEFEKVLKGIDHEKQGVFFGDDIMMPFAAYWFTFHIQESLVPGVTILLAIPSLLGLLFYVVKLPKSDYWKTSILVLTVVIFYTVVEMSPKRPAPDFMRYIIPIIPAIIALGYLFILQAAKMISGARSQYISISIILLLAIYPIYDSIMLVHHLINDTRAQVYEMLGSEATEGEVLYEYYASGEAKNDTWMFNYFDWTKAVLDGNKYAVTSSFSYDRFLLAKAYPDQPDWVIHSIKRYDELFEKLPYKEVRPAYKSFAFSNPTLRILDLKDAERLSFVKLDTTANE